MAPGRRKGANKAKNAVKLTLGDLVLAKVKGFPAWPAKVSRPEDWERTSDPKKYFVQFFGTQEIAFVAPADIQVFTSELRSKLLSRCKGKTVKFFSQAVNEISEAFDELERNKAGVSGYLLEHCADVQESTKVMVTKLDAPSECDGVENKCGEQKITEESTHEEPMNTKGMEETSSFNERVLSTKSTSSSPSCAGGSTVCGKSKMPRDRHYWKGSNNESYRRVECDVTPSDRSYATLKNASVNSQNDLVCWSNELAVASCPEEEKNDHLSSKRKNITDTERRDSAKRSKQATSGSNSTRSIINNGEKKHLLNLGSPVEAVERKSVSMTDGSLSGPQLNKGAVSSSIPVCKTSPLSKHHCPLSDVKKGSFSAIQKPDLVKKRRAICLYDDGEDDVPKTPVHGVSIPSLKVSSPNWDYKSKRGAQLKSGVHDLKGTCRRDDASPLNGRTKEASSHNDAHSCKSQECSPIPVAEGVDKSEMEVGSLISAELDPKREFAEKSMAEVILPDLQVCAAEDSCLGEQNDNQIFLKGPGIGGEVKSHIPTAKVSQFRKAKQVFSEEGPKVIPNAIAEGGSAASSRAKDTQIVKCKSSGDSKTTDSATSIKSLIAAAQAKRRQAQQGDLVHELAFSDDFQRKDPSPISTGKPLLSESSNSKQISAVGIPQISIVSHNGHINGSEEQEIKPDLGYQSGSSSLSGGTEAAVARDAFEGMIETLSRTKESIGRATRLAVDCAKYGIANEVVDLLVRKLETEASFHRKVDLFFLVDSITQCSHNQKGLAGAMYIPAIEVALPRLLGAAAPPGASARENRRQCHKVLRLWLERRILPESVLKRFMDDLGAPRDEVNTSLSSRRPSRAERTVDDPIRGMEGMLVDEYGSNATFELPGFFLSRAFDDDDDEVEEDVCVPGALKECAEVCLTGSAEAALQMAGVVAPNDRSHHILEDVDGELEMEDISGMQKGEVGLSTSGSSRMHEHGLLREINWSTNDEDEALTPEGPPPLPFEPPPLLPPLPSSPPPPLPPLSPPPLPPPPPPLQMRATSVLTPGIELPAVHPSLPPQPPFSIVAIPHAHIPLSPSLQLTYARPVPLEFSNMASGNQTTDVTGNCQQQSTAALAAVGGSRNPSSQLEYGNHYDMFINSHCSQPNPHLQPSYSIQSHAPFHQPPPLPAQTPSSQFSFSKPSVQQHLQPPYASSHQSVSFLDNRASFGPDSRLKASGEYTLDSQHDKWMNSGRIPPSSATPFIADGCYPPIPERSAATNMGFQHSHRALNSVPAGYTNLTNSQMFRSRPDISTRNCWRPA